MFENEIRPFSHSKSIVKAVYVSFAVRWAHKIHHSNNLSRAGRHSFEIRPQEENVIFTCTIHSLSASICFLFRFYSLSTSISVMLSWKWDKSFDVSFNACTQFEGRFSFLFFSFFNYPLIRWKTHVDKIYRSTIIVWMVLLSLSS